ncbi:MAG: 50S ribosomal protein L5 [Berkelbacteria bacterium GW2011_GWA2_35_9]|uniref:50S ribosomal protein L5 n=1 Tax=Berkelbacteria bacterium GW2011_GWA2_35_9 TaxID=1618333 RepID=A0A0G0DKB3_9BACT|nr:MAG: 50S ribosomal protein L5 [Berkelbacteria bacterium GW2011_GWA2_35_9]
MINLNKIYEKIAQEDKVNYFSVVRISKVIVSTGFGKFRDNQAKIDQIKKDLIAMTGQKPAYCQAKNAISAFKLRKNEIIGYKTTLRAKKMEDFLDRLVNLTLPNIRDFKGINLDSLDKSNNLSLGIKEHFVFPEIPFDTPSGIIGVSITIVFKNSSDRQKVIHLLKYIGFPIGKEDKIKK